MDNGAEARPSPSEGGAAPASEGIVKAGATVLSAHVLFKLLAFVLSIVIARKYGAGAVSDAYTVTFSGIFMLFFLVGEEALGPAFLPLFMERKNAGDEKGAWRFASIIGSWQIVILLAATAALLFLPAEIIGWVTELERDKPATMDLAAGFLRIMAPGLVAFSLATLTYMLLNGYKRFFWAAFGDGSMRIVTIAAIVLLGSASGLGPNAIAWGILAGCFAKLVTHLVPLRREIRNSRFSLNLRDPTFRRFLLLVAPLVGGILFAKFRDFFNQIYVLSCVKEQGIIALHRFGKGIFDTLHYLVPYALSIAMFPFFCELTDRDDRQALARILGRSCRLLLWVFVPASIGIAVTSEPFARGIFTGGEMTGEKAQLIGMVNMCYCIGLPFYAMETLVMRAFFSSQRMVIPVAIGIVTSALSMAVSYWFVVVRGADGADALMVISLAFALSRVLKTSLLVIALRIRLPFLPVRELAPFLAKLAVVGLATLAAAWGVRAAFESEAVRAQVAALPVLARAASALAARPATRYLGEVAACAAAGGLAFLLASRILRMEELADSVAFLKGKLARRRK